MLPREVKLMLELTGLPGAKVEMHFNCQSSSVKM